MRQGLMWRIGVIAIVLALSAFYLLPSSEAVRQSPLASILPDSRVNLGLDLVGGMHLTLGVDVDKALENSLAQAGQDVRNIARDKGIMVLRPRLVGTDRLEFILPRADQRSALDKILTDQFSFLNLSSPQDMGNGQLRYLASFTPEYRTHTSRMALDQAVTTIRNRIDQFGVSEPDIRSQPEDNRIVIQLPGIQDAERAVSIVGQTAHLEFFMVRPDVDPGRASLPSGTKRLPVQGRESESGRFLIVDAQPVLTGEYIDSANAATDSSNHKPYVAISFNSRGASLFENITGENINRQMAIVLDGVIHSAPVIQTKIFGGRASITGNFSMQEAQDLALVLRAGSLPAPVSILEERTVGPSLGQESIDKGVKAALYGGALVMVFMVIYYSLSGLVANLMLILDVFLILAGLAFFGGTLTLPGIAGIVLTLGMAVDANVLIFERIREEIKNGLTPLAAVHAGFSRATLTITDSNLTTIIAAVVLYQFGTGPIRGFAVTLTLGVIASMFTAIFVSRVIYDLWMGKGGRKLSI